MENFIAELREKNSELNRQAAELRAQNRGDEAVFCTVMANVYDICATVCGFWAKKDDVNKCGEILNRFRNEWGEALENAKKQDNAKKICIEEAKLEALNDVVAGFEQR